MNFESPQLNNEISENKLEEEKKTRNSAIMEVSVEDDNEKEILLNHFSRINKENAFDIELEKEKTEDEVAIIKQINEKMQSFVAEHGGISIDIKPENIHFLDRNKITTERLKEIKRVFSDFHSRGTYIFGKERIALCLIEGEDNVEFAKVLTHEMMHLNSFQSIKIEWGNTRKNSGKFFEEKIGLANIEKKEKIQLLFHKLNEALTEELAILFAEENFSDIKELESGIKTRQKILGDKGDNINELLDLSIRTVEDKKGGFTTTIKGVETYIEEREYLKGLRNDLYRLNKGKFSSPKEVALLFSRAYFSGDNSELEKLIDDTFGQGSFDKIGHETSIETSREGFSFEVNNGT